MAINVGTLAGSKTTIRGFNSSTSNSFTITIPDVGDTAKADVRWMGSTAAATAVGNGLGTIQLIDSTTLQATRGNGTISWDISWEVSYEA